MIFNIYCLKNVKGETSFDIISWLPSDKDLREIFKDLKDAAAAHFEVVNEEIKDFNSKLVNDALNNIEEKIEDLHKEHTKLATELELILREQYELQDKYDNSTSEDEKNKLLEQIGKLKANERIREYSFFNL